MVTVPAEQAQNNCKKTVDSFLEADRVTDHYGSPQLFCGSIAVASSQTLFPKALSWMGSEDWFVICCTLNEQGGPTGLAVLVM